MTHRTRIQIALIVLVVGLFVLNISPARAATITALQDGDWDNPTTWDCNCVPVAADDVVVPALYTVSNYGIITTAGTITINGTLSNYGTLTNTGTIINNEYLGNHDTLINQGTIDNGFYMLNFDTFTNNGLIITETFINDATFTNNGTLTIIGGMTNDNILINNGVILVTSGGIENNSVFTNYGTLTFNGALLNYGIVTNYGVLSNYPVFAGIDNYGTLTNICPGIYQGEPPQPYTNPVTYIPCEEDGSALPLIVSDGRISANDGRAVIYVFPGQGIQVYGVQRDSVGWLAAYVPASELDDCPPPPSENLLLASDATGKYRIYRLTTCEYQVEVGPFGEDGKVEVTIFTLVAGTPTHVYYTEYFVIPPQ